MTHSTMSALTSLTLLLLGLLLTFVRSATPPYSCSGDDAQTKNLPFCNRNLRILARARDLVSRLTLDEKIAQLANGAEPIPRLGIPGFQWWSEGLHGLADSKGMRFDLGPIKAATSFPQVILTGATFNTDLWYRIGQVIGTEARGMYNEGQADGMTLWAPNINIFRDPRWGRGQETPGEDPMTTQKYAISYVRGVQGDTFQGGGEAMGSGLLMASACCKHFTAYDLENWNGTDRYNFDAQVTAQDLADTYQPPFQSCVQEARASGVMCAYNSVNGVPNCADYNLLTNVARKQWSFNGYITADCDAVANIFETHKYTKTPEDAVADALKAGMDLDCGLYLKTYTQSALQQKKVDISDIDRALVNLFAVRIRLGLFNGDPRYLPFGNIGPDQVCSRDHQNLALDVARQGIVLLKNDANLLPLPKSGGISLAVIGPNADAAETLLGNYHGPPCRSVSPLQALRKYTKNIKYHTGCVDVSCESLDPSPAVNLARGADYVVLIMGLDQSQEAESHDRYDLNLPGQQQKLITSVADAAKKPVILVLLSGGPLDVTFAKNDPKIGGILWAGYPGEAGGRALAKIIFGDHNPGGKLPMTWYPQEYVEAVAMTDMRMRAVPSEGYPGRTYRFYKGETVFPFGYGLSYSKHVYDFVHVSHNIIHLSQAGGSDLLTFYDKSYIKVSELDAETCQNKRVHVRVSVRNRGEMASKHPVLLFARPDEVADENQPVKQLVGFETVRLEPGERGEVGFVVSPCEHLARADENGAMVVGGGLHFFIVEDQEHPVAVRIH